MALDRDGIWVIANGRHHQVDTLAGKHPFNEKAQYGNENAGKECRPEPREFKPLDQLGNQHDHQGIDDERKKAERYQREWKGENE